MDQLLVEEYIRKLPYSEVFTDLPQMLKDRIIFGSEQMLKRRFAHELVTDEVVALQALFVAEGEEEEFAKFKRQGITSVSVKGLSLSIKGSEVSPEVLTLLGEENPVYGDTGVFFGRLM